MPIDFASASCSNIKDSKPSRPKNSGEHFAVEKNKMPVTQDQISRMISFQVAPYRRHAHSKYTARFQNAMNLRKESKDFRAGDVLAYVFGQNHIGNAIAVRQWLSYINLGIVIVPAVENV